MQDFSHFGCGPTVTNTWKVSASSGHLQMHAIGDYHDAGFLSQAECTHDS